MKSLVAAAALVAAAFFFTGIARAATLCVGPQSGCFAQLQPALDAASDGDTVTIARGTYAGGVTVDKSVRIQGAGSAKTVIGGGGPVITIFRAEAPDGLNVSIDGVTITGGVNSTQPDGEVTFGGGVAIPVAQLDHPPFNGVGATVAISNSVVTGNTVRSDQIVPSGFCDRPCGFNTGGGIDNGGVLTLTNTRVTDNTSGSTAATPSAATDASAGGISSHFASTLVLNNVTVSGNRAMVYSPFASSASSGGISSSGALDIENSSISNNVVDYTGSTDIGEENGLAGGMQIDECCGVTHATATVRNTLVNGNGVTAANSDPAATPFGYAGAILATAPALLDHVIVTDNTVQVTGAGFAGADAGGMEVDAPVTVQDGLFARNSVSATGPLGSAAGGGGVAMFGGDLTIVRTLVIGNTVSASGAAAALPFGGVSSAFGGGIANGGFDGVPPATLTMSDSVVTGNRVTAGAGYVVHGGGLYTDWPASLTRTVVAGNKPDNCFGC
ncbi:MAG TPA: hypothetical protein VF094_09430 [Gaiellaceae bacterium]